MAENLSSEASSSSSIGRGESVVTDHGRRRSSCGYCKSGGYSSLSHGIWAHSITVDDYQELLDHGWRRSGSFLYKPEMESTCCPSYTIRLKAENFMPSKEQLRVYRRMQRFLDGVYTAKKSHHCKDDPTLVLSASSSVNVRESSAKDLFDKSKGEYNNDHYIHYLSNKIDSAVSVSIERGELPSGICLPKAVVKKVTQQTKKKISKISGDLLYTSSVSFQIAAALRRHLSSNKQDCQFELLEKSATQHGQFFEFSPTVIAEKLASLLEQLGDYPGVSVKACNGHLNFYSSDYSNASDEMPTKLDVANQSPNACARNAKRGHLTNTGINSPAKRRRLEIRLKRSSFDPEEYALYKKYQIKVHNDRPDHVKESSYRNFLVDTPIIFVPSTGTSSVPPFGFGSFHQQYLVDGKLIAVGVVDILPRCLSSKYLFWDPDLSFLSLGKYTALQEIEWVRDAQVHCPSLQYYYLGYYIHSCSKMRYKAAYSPSELLCPVRYQWVRFDIVKPLLDKKPYVILSDFMKPANGTSPQLLLEDFSVNSSADHEVMGMSGSSSDEDVGMEPDIRGSDIGVDEGFGTETREVASIEELNGDVSEIVIELNGTRVRFKDLQRAFGPIKEKHLKALEQQLHRYTKVVGPELANRMVYSLR
ncbi:arginyl-tRNA--protein transferase 2-like [Aristolochia californica]|uniref:arginyl-tRNA--protein transferase 2-like n=1 Tax=Aristolochia californica TaxID=171875 RepID=UPI0035E32923